jgi:glycerophosphoryl diester phosphodiesterase
MNWFEIVAHRGVSTGAPENTLPAFQRAIDIGADAVELDVRLTKDRVPVVFHYFYLDELTELDGPIFTYTYEQLREAKFTGVKDGQDDLFRILSLREVLETIGGQIGMEIEIKGPEPEAPKIIGKVLNDYRSLWDRLEVTSFEPQLLVGIRRECPGIHADLLFPRSEPWMRLDVVGYAAINRARLAGARAVHLHPSQLSHDVVSSTRDAGIEVHSWEVNDRKSLEKIVEHNIPKICTDRLEEAVAFRAE